MSAFDAKNGRIHFLFANEEDVYYTKSLLRMDFRQYMYYRLKNSGYKAILSIRSGEAQDGYQVEIPDLPSWKLYARYVQGDLLLRWKAPALPAQRTAPKKEILKMLQDTSSAAFLLSLRTFQKLFRGQEEQLRVLMARKNAKSIFILKGRTNGDRNLRVLERKGSIFADSALFPQLHAAFSADEAGKKSCFARLRELLGERCIFFNDFSREAVQNVLQYGLWKTYGLEAYTTGQIRLAAAYISAWYRSIDMQEEFPGALSKNPKRLFSKLEEEIRESWPQLKRDAIRWEAQKQHYTMLEEVHVYADNALTRKFDEIRLPGRLQRVRPLAAHQHRMLERLFHTPLPIILKPELWKKPEEELEKLKDALQKEDWERVLEAEEALLELLSECTAAKEEPAVLWTEAYGEKTEQEAPEAERTEQAAEPEDAEKPDDTAESAGEESTGPGEIDEQEVGLRLEQWLETIEEQESGE